MKQNITVIEPLDIMTRPQRYIMLIKSASRVNKELPFWDNVNIPKKSRFILGESFIELILHESQQKGMWVPQLVQENIGESYSDDEYFFYHLSLLKKQNSTQGRFSIFKSIRKKSKNLKSYYIMQRHLQDGVKEALYKEYPIEAFYRHIQEHPRIVDALGEKFPQKEDWVKYWQENDSKFKFYKKQDLTNILEVIKSCYPLPEFHKPKRPASQPIVL